MAQFNGQTDNHNMDREIISPSDWGRDIEIDKELVRRDSYQGKRLKNKKEK